MWRGRHGRLDTFHCRPNPRKVMQQGLSIYCVLLISSIANDLEDYFTRHLPEGSYAISDIHSYNGEDEFYHVLRNYDTEDGMSLCGDNVDDGAFFTWDDEGGIPKSEFEKLYNENYPKKDKADSPLDLTMRYVLDKAKWEYIDNCSWD